MAHHHNLSLTPNNICKNRFLSFVFLSQWIPLIDFSDPKYISRLFQSNKNFEKLIDASNNILIQNLNLIQASKHFVYIKKSENLPSRRWKQTNFSSKIEVFITVNQFYSIFFRFFFFFSDWHTQKIGLKFNFLRIWENLLQIYQFNRRYKITLVERKEKKEYTLKPLDSLFKKK